MKLLFIAEHNTGDSLNQVIMFVPDDYDHARVRQIAHECGIRNPNTMLAVPFDPKRISDQIEEYAAFSR